MRRHIGSLDVATMIPVAAIAVIATLTVGPARALLGYPLAFSLGWVLGKIDERRKRRREEP